MKGRTTISIALAAILLTGIVIVPAMGMQISPQDRSMTNRCVRKHSATAYRTEA